MRSDLHLSPAIYDELKANLNIVINCAAFVDLSAKIDMAVRVNVTGPLNLLKLAH